MTASTDCSKITDYFDIQSFADSVIDIPEVCSIVNETIGTCSDGESRVAPLLKLMFENAIQNSKKKSSKGHRHDDTIKEFSASLLCLIGNAGYELIQANLGNALPHVSSSRRLIYSHRKVIEGEFYFDELKCHLTKFKAPLFVNIQLDDTRIINKVEYDPVTDRFVGFCLPIHNGVPSADAFILQTFDDIKHALDSENIGKYAHCIVVKSIDTSVPSFVLFTMCTDSKYNHQQILQRWNYIQQHLSKIGITVVSNGADGAGPFLKAMTMKTSLFYREHKQNVPKYWTFYWMPDLSPDSLVCQDIIHLLAKLRTRLLTPSNLIVIGDEVACRAHLVQVLKKFPKSDHELTQQIIENKDKQNYSSIEVLLSSGVEECLKKMECKERAKGTLVYLWIMRNIRDTFFDKSISPLQRVSFMWRTIFFLRIWRVWLEANGYSESDHFITQNAYVCAELNGHLLINILYNVINDKFPKETLRMWTYGSQACEQLFRLLRSMTSTFSTIINFSMKGMHVNPFSPRTFVGKTANPFCGGVLFLKRYANLRVVLIKTHSSKNDNFSHKGSLSLKIFHEN